ncbi:LLM class flavin-dependent oxidoreductase [Nonomuraea sp. NPDC049158]|uniref:LLM class flavin-dependent oxidoreductase n=1 Tax=Nonomuraea sp. NPDC049158 TaxID=3155649 RepID=UPI0033F9A984
MTSAQRPLMISPRFLDPAELTTRVQLAERLGVDQLWLEQQPDQRDATLMAATYLNAAPAMTVGTAVLPIYARHPVSMAQSAATLAELSRGRFILGLGYSHQFINEYVLGYKQGPPIAVMREYLSIVRDLTNAGAASVEGRYFTARSQYADPYQPVPIYLAALRPQMIRLAVEFGQGIVIWLCSARYVREQVMPVVREACAALGKREEDFTVLTILPAYTGDDLVEQTNRWEKTTASYRMLPYYRHVLDAYGKPEPGELSLIGTREQVQERLAQFRDAGCVPAPSPMPGTEQEFIQTVEAAYQP